MSNANTPDATAGLRSSPPTGSAFLRESVEKRLAELREKCALEKAGLQDATGPRPWGDGQYWATRKAEAARTRTLALEAALRELSDFIAEHRPLMGAAWIGNDHGRLCWDQYIGGLPVAFHYCQKPEGHKSHHGDHEGLWRRRPNAEVREPRHE